MSALLPLKSYSVHTMPETSSSKISYALDVLIIIRPVCMLVTGLFACPNTFSNDIATANEL